MVGVSGSPDPKGEVGDLLKLGVETGVGKGDTHFDLRKEAFGRPQSGREIRVTRDDDQGVAGPQVQELNSLDPMETSVSLSSWRSMVLPQ